MIIKWMIKPYTCIFLLPLLFIKNGSHKWTEEKGTETKDEEQEKVMKNKTRALQKAGREFGLTVATHTLWLFTGGGRETVNNKVTIDSDKYCHRTRKKGRNRSIILSMKYVN
jgi:hypothetical protein